MIGGMGALTTLSQLSDAKELFTNQQIDLNDPVQNALAYAKLVGTAARSMVHIYYKGTIFGKLINSEMCENKST